MAWGAWTLGTETTVQLGNLDFSSLDGLSLTTFEGPNLESLLGAPMTAGLIEIKDNRLTAVGAAPDFPVLPKWRKVVRQIG